MCKIFICFKIVVFPDSPVPSNNTFSPFSNCLWTCSDVRFIRFEWRASSVRRLMQFSILLRGLPRFCRNKQNKMLWKTPKFWAKHVFLLLQDRVNWSAFVFATGFYWIWCDFGKVCFLSIQRVHTLYNEGLYQTNEIRQTFMNFLQATTTQTTNGLE